MKVYSIKYSDEYASLNSLNYKDVGYSCDMIYEEDEHSKDELYKQHWYINPDDFIGDKILKNKRIVGNFIDIMLHMFAFDEKVYNSAIFPLLQTTGQVIPLDMSHDPVYPEKKLWLYTCNTRIDCLDREKSEIDYFQSEPKGIMWINSYTLILSQLSKTTLFNIPEQTKGPLFSISKPDSPESDFYKIYTENSFTGLQFTECKLS